MPQKNFLLSDGDNARLKALVDDLGDANEVDVVRSALVALRLMTDQGYDFSWFRGPGLVLKHDADKRTTAWFQLGDDDKLTLIGEQPFKARDE